MYDTIVEKLSTTPLIAPCYLIVVGSELKQGAIITRNRDGEENRLCIESSTADSPHIAQTNIDHWKTEGIAPAFSIESCETKLCSLLVEEHWAYNDPLLLSAVIRRDKAYEVHKVHNDI